MEEIFFFFLKTTNYISLTVYVFPNLHIDCNIELNWLSNNKVILNLKQQVISIEVRQIETDNIITDDNAATENWD